MIPQEKQTLSQTIHAASEIMINQVLDVKPFTKTSDSLHVISDSFNKKADEIKSENPGFLVVAEEIKSLSEKLDGHLKEFKALKSNMISFQFHLEKYINTSKEDFIEQLKLLPEKVEEIEKMHKSMHEVTAELNLLTLNSAIEAAHADDKGKPFAVEAEKLRKLAELSRTATTIIENGIKELKIQHKNIFVMAGLKTNTPTEIFKKVMDFLPNFKLTK